MNQMESPQNMDIYGLADEVNQHIRPSGYRTEISGTYSTCVITMIHPSGKREQLYDGNATSAVIYLTGIMTGLILGNYKPRG